MREPIAASIINLESAQAALREHFLGWQCRIRQYAMRQGGGRPTPGMRPSAFLPQGDYLAAITTLLVKADPLDITAQFRHMVLKTQDPADRYRSALGFLSAAYYQRPLEFSDRLTALFGPLSDTAEQLIDAGRCRLDFDQYRQRYRIPCQVRRLVEQDGAYQATYWHNRLFNASPPGEVQILAFKPDWLRAEAEPAVS